MNYKKLLQESVLRGYGVLHSLTNHLYKFRHENYGKFPGRREKMEFGEAATEIIYCFWTGENEMSQNRKSNLKETIKNVGVPVVLVTPNNLKNYIKAGFPLHPAYPYLSAVHKSDYLRCYFMHHWGGGYTDIKMQTQNWSKSFKNLNSSPDKIAVSYKEVYWGASKIENISNDSKVDALNKDLYHHYGYLLGICSFIFKPYSSFTKDWITEVNKRLDDNLEKLKQNPGNIWGNNEGYPLPWTFILGQIYHPLCLKYHKFLLKDNRLKPSFTDYR